MAEQTKSISEARQNLPNLSLNAQQRMERYVITNQGRPQSVLVGYDDYQKMRAATEILLDPRARGSIGRGLDEFQARQGLTADQVRERLRNRKTVIAGESQISAAATRYTAPDPLNKILFDPNDILDPEKVIVESVSPVPVENWPRAVMVDPETRPYRTVPYYPIEADNTPARAAEEPVAIRQEDLATESNFLENEG